MLRFLIRLVGKFNPGLAVVLHNAVILGAAQGQLRSARERMAVDKDGQVLPWYTYPTIEYLRSLDFSACDVFEFGSGNSSRYWAGRARSVVSVEANGDWYGVVDKLKLDNQRVLHRGDEAGYVGALAEQGRKFQVIIIDGEWRRACTEAALQHIDDQGMIIVDNSDRKIEKECAAILRENGFFQIDFSGFGPINPYCWSTSLFVRNAIGLQTRHAGPVPVGGLGN